MVESLPAYVTFMPPLRVILDRRPKDHNGDDGDDCYPDCWVAVHCVTWEQYWNETLWMYDDLSELHHYILETQIASIGDTLTYVWYPEAGCGAPGEPP